MGTEHACTQDRFLQDAAKHVMTVIRDDGVNRHIRFKREGSSAYWFDLITWPGALCIDGDMGTYVFRRLDDMFEFFRTDQEHYNQTGRSNQLAINTGYWSEKLTAPNSRDAQEFSADSFRRHVQEAFDNWVASNKPDEDDFSTKEELEEFQETKTTLWDALEYDVLATADDGDIRSYDAAREFQCDEAPNFNMEDCWEWNCREYRFHFIWCCYAIAWGIKRYDALKTNTVN